MSGRLSLAAPLAVMLLLGGCASTGSTQSYVEPTVSEAEAATLASDAATYLVDPLPPAHTTLVLDPPAAKVQDTLTAALIPALRERGYGVTLAQPGRSASSGGGVALRYIASPLDGGLLLRLQYQGKEASRHYPRASDGQLMSGAPFTVGGKAR